MNRLFLKIALPLSLLALLIAGRMSEIKTENFDTFLALKTDFSEAEKRRIKTDYLSDNQRIIKIFLQETEDIPAGKKPGKPLLYGHRVFWFENGNIRETDRYSRETLRILTLNLPKNDKVSLHISHGRNLWIASVKTGQLLLWDFTDNQAFTKSESAFSARLEGEKINLHRILAPGILEIKAGGPDSLRISAEKRECFLDLSSQDFRNYRLSEEYEKSEITTSEQTEFSPCGRFFFRLSPDKKFISVCQSNNSAEVLSLPAEEISEGFSLAGTENRIEVWVNRPASGQIRLFVLEISETAKPAGEILEAVASVR